MFKDTVLDFRFIDWIEYIDIYDPIYEELDIMSDPEFEEYYKWLGDYEVSIYYDEVTEGYVIYPVDKEDEVEYFLERLDTNIDIDKYRDKYDDEILNEYIKLYDEILNDEE